MHGVGVPDRSGSDSSWLVVTLHLRMGGAKRQVKENSRLDTSAKPHLGFELLPGSELANVQKSTYRRFDVLHQDSHDLYVGFGC